MTIITHLDTLVMNAASNYIATNSSTFKSTEVGPVGLTGPVGSQGPQGIAGINGINGEDLTIEQIAYNGDGTFTWHFSDSTTYVTPNMVGPQGAPGVQGDKGDTGISVHHTKGTSTTDSEGNFSTAGEDDTYTLYGDADETEVLGYFTVHNGSDAGLSSVDIKALYESNTDTNTYTDAEQEKLAGIINDGTTSTLTTYSSSKIQELYNAQADMTAPLDSPVLTGVPKAPTASVSTNTSQIATTEYVVNEINKTEEW